MQRDLSTFPLAQHVRFKLRTAGFSTVEDLNRISPSELARETQLTNEEALEVLDLVAHEDGTSYNGTTTATVGISALDLLLEENSRPPIPTFCQAIDDILGGGIPLKKVTELCGMPGAGKTQMCLQLCVNVQIPSECGGLDGEAVYIDTEGSFTVDRLTQMADATVDTCQKIVKSSNNPAAAVGSFVTQKVLAGIHFFHCKSYTELIAIVKILPEFLQQHPKVRLLIVDSICFHFRYGFDENYVLRNKLLNGLSQSLIKMANEFTMGVLVTNQMTTRIQENESNCVIPALGKSWGHACTIRIILSWDEQGRQAMLFKSPYREDASACYQITVNGIRDCPRPAETNDSHPSTSMSMETIHQNKRQRIDTPE